MLHFQQEAADESTEEGNAMLIINLTLKILVLKFLRLSALHQGYPVKNSVELAVIEDIIAQLKEMLESTKNLSPSLLHGLWGRPMSLSREHGHSDHGCDLECSSSALWSLCQSSSSSFFFEDSSQQGLDYNVVMKSCSGTSGAANKKQNNSVSQVNRRRGVIEIPLIMVVIMMVDEIYRIIAK
jgi:hypothetical protein